MPNVPHDEAVNPTKRQGLVLPNPSTESSKPEPASDIAHKQELLLREGSGKKIARDTVQGQLRARLLPDPKLPSPRRRRLPPPSGLGLASSFLIS
ncbi:hypothetical protein ACP70R_045005 [Stipagrostis hirtigluma subsp. patula]